MTLGRSLDACALQVRLGARGLTLRGISQQAYALGPKILEVERWLPSSPCPVYEVHPEVSFAVLLGEPARASKKTWAGMVERRRALEAAGIHGRHRRRRRRSGVGGRHAGRSSGSVVSRPHNRGDGSLLARSACARRSGPTSRDLGLVGHGDPSSLVSFMRL